MIAQPSINEIYKFLIREILRKKPVELAILRLLDVT